MSVEQVAAAIQGMSYKEREALLLRMANMDDILEDLEDIVDLPRAARETTRPYEEFLSDLRAEGRGIYGKTAEKQMRQLPANVFRSINEKVLTLRISPRPHGVKKLVGGLDWRIRAGD